jgi:hypothetical protein
MTFYDKDQIGNTGNRTHNLSPYMNHTFYIIQIHFLYVWSL